MNDDAHNRSFLVSVAVALVAITLTALTFSALDDTIPSLNLRTDGAGEGEIVPVSRLEPLFDRQAIAALMPSDDWRNPFHTLHFQPPPPPPKPAPPQTTTHTLVYKGYYEAADGARAAFFQVDGASAVITKGESVIGGHILSAIEPSKAVLTKGEKTLEIPFSQETAIEFPIP